MSVSFDSETGAATVHEEDGSVTTFTANGLGSFSASPRVLATFARNEDGTYTFSRYADHIQYLFSETGQLLREVDRNGNTTTLTYSSGLLEKVTDPSGRTLTFTYTGSHIHTITDPLGRTTTFNYDANGNLTNATNALGRSWSFTYDAHHLLLSMTDPRGGTTNNTYDTSDRVTAQTDPAGRTLTWSYSGEPTTPEGGTTTLTDARGDITIYDYKNLELISITHGAGTPSEATTSYQYDPTTLGRTVIIDPDGDITRNTYDTHGNPTSSTDPLGRTTYFAYGSFDELTYVVDPQGTPTYYSYDGSGNLLEKETLLTETDQYVRTTYGYEAAPGEITSVTDPDGHTTTYTYDTAGDRTSSTDPNGNTTTYAYDADGKLTTKTSPNGHLNGANPAAYTTSYTYDAGGELISETDPMGHTTSYVYDGDGNRASIVDANGHTTQQTYDADNELIQITRADGSILKTQWDAAGNMVAQVDGAGHTTSYAYDPLNRLISITDPDSHTTSYTYDAAGRKIAMIDAEGQITGYTYDAAGELTNISYSDGQTPNVSESYDADGRRIEMTDGSGTSTFTYDSLNRMTSTTDGSGATTGYTYDPAGHLITLTYPNGKSVTRAYDPAGNLTSVTDWLGHTTHFTYDANSNVTGDQYPNSVNTQLTYDPSDHITGITDTNGPATLASFDYTRDDVGQVTSETASNGASTKTSYTRDALDQLTSANSTHYSYDAADNPTTYNDATQTFDPANELTSNTTAPGLSETPEEKPKTGGPEVPTQAPKEIPQETPHGLSAGTTPTTTPDVKQGIAGVHADKAPSPRVDAVVSASSNGHSSKLASPKLRTHSPHDLVLALVSGIEGQHAKHISGDGLRWSLIARSQNAGGTTEAWQAHTSRTLHEPIAAQLSKPGHASITVAAFAGSATYVATHAVAHGHASTPEAHLTAPSGSLLWTVGHSNGQRRAVKPAGGHIVYQLFDQREHTSGWIQQSATSSSSAGISDAASSGDWGMVVIAIASREGRIASTMSRMHQKAQDTASGPATTSLSKSETPVAAPKNSTATPDTSVSTTRNFFYNARGDRTQETTPADSTVSLVYDQADRLIQYGTTAFYAYNGDGLRIAKTVNGTSVHFVWNQTEAAPELLQDGSTYYIYGPNGQPIEQISSETSTYLHQDQQGSTRLLTDATGSIVGRYSYDPWGQVTNHTGDAATNLQYDGQYTDAETGFQYLRARYYDPATGQLLTVDPAFAITLHQYGFSANDPLDLTDPLGLFSLSGFFHGASFVVGVVGLAAAGCVLTACVADVAAVGAIAVGAGVIGTGLDVAGAITDCSQSRDLTCGEDTVGVGLDIVSLGAAHYIPKGLLNDAVGFGFSAFQTTLTVDESLLSTDSQSQRTVVLVLCT